MDVLSLELLEFDRVRDAIAARAESLRARATVAAVLLEPAPAMTAIRRPTALHARSASVASSASVSVADSPVVPPTTIPAVAFCRCQSMSADHAAKSRAPSGFMGVAIATRLPENMAVRRCWWRCVPE